MSAVRVLSIQSLMSPSLGQEFMEEVLMWSLHLQRLGSVCSLVRVLYGIEEEDPGGRPDFFLVDCFFCLAVIDVDFSAAIWILHR